MASSVSGQDEPNRSLWLATRAGKMEPSCPLGTTRCIPQAKFHQKPYNKTSIDQVCSIKMAGYWPLSFFASLWTSTSSRSINTQKKEFGQYPAILTSHLVNNPYVQQRPASKQYTAPYDCWDKNCWNVALFSFKAVILVKKIMKRRYHCGVFQMDFYDSSTQTNGMNSSFRCIRRVYDLFQYSSRLFLSVQRLLLPSWSTSGTCGKY